MLSCLKAPRRISANLCHFQRYRQENTFDHVGFLLLRSDSSCHNSGKTAARFSFIFFHRTPHCTLYTLYTLPSTQKPKPSAVAILPQYHFSSPCKLSCSEPQRTRHSVELRSSSIFLRFPRALDDFPSFSVVFFLPFSWHSSIFLPFLRVFNDFPSFFSYLFPVIPPFSSVFPLLWTIFLHFLSFLSYLFPGIPPFSSIFPLFSTIFLRFFPTFFLSFLHLPPFSPCFQRFSFIFLGFFLPFSCRSQRT